MPTPDGRPVDLCGSGGAHGTRCYGHCMLAAGGGVERLGRRQVAATRLPNRAPRAVCAAAARGRGMLISSWPNSCSFGTSFNQRWFCVEHDDDAYNGNYTCLKIPSARESSHCVIVRVQQHWKVGVATCPAMWYGPAPLHACAGAHEHTDVSPVN